MPKSARDALLNPMIEFAHIAARFSKLFMAHLDTEFQKQADPTLKTLISSQVCSGTFSSVLGSRSSKFQGNQTYVTTCQKCDYRSERSSDFLEVEVTLTVGTPSSSQTYIHLIPDTEQLDARRTIGRLARARGSDGRQPVSLTRCMLVTTF